jgi:hypothetical protein
LLVERRRIEVRPLADGESLTLIDLNHRPATDHLKTTFGLRSARKASACMTAAVAS